MLRLSTLSLVAALLLLGCSAAKPLTPLNQTVPIRAGVSALTIISPQEQHLPASAFNALTEYDYYLDCLDAHCRVGTMHMLQYITIYPNAGNHTLHVKQSASGLINVVDTNATQSIPFSATADSRQFIYHGWEFSWSSLAAPIITTPSKLSTIDETSGQTKLQKVLDTTSIFGNKMNGYGERGTTY